MRADDVACEVPGYAAVRCTDSTSQLSYRVLVAGTGPPVIVLHEMPGAGQAYLNLACHLRSAGYRTWLPIFFEPAGRDIGSIAGFARVCIRREFRNLARGAPTPLTAWLHALVDHVTAADRETSGSGRAAVIGMCMTGGLVFGLLLEQNLAAVVSAQPALPFLRALPADASAIGSAAARGGDARVPLLALRFAGDRLSSPRRVAEARALATTQSCRAAAADARLDARECGPLRAVEAPGRRHATLTYHAAAAGGAMVDEVLAFLTRHHPAAVTGGDA